MAVAPQRPETLSRLITQYLEMTERQVADGVDDFTTWTLAMAKEVTLAKALNRMAGLTSGQVEPAPEAAEHTNFPTGLTVGNDMSGLFTDARDASNLVDRATVEALQQFLALVQFASGDRQSPNNKQVAQRLTLDQDKVSQLPLVPGRATPEALLTTLDDVTTKVIQSIEIEASIIAEFAVNGLKPVLPSRPGDKLARANGVALGEPDVRRSPTPSRLQIELDTLYDQRKQLIADASPSTTVNDVSERAQAWYDFVDRAVEYQRDHRPDGTLRPLLEQELQRCQYDLQALSQGPERDLS